MVGKIPISGSGLLARVEPEENSPRGSDSSQKQIPHFVRDDNSVGGEFSMNDNPQCHLLDKGAANRLEGDLRLKVWSGL